jgi:hypothetical protein
MPVERRGQVTAVGSEPTGNRRSSNSQRRAAAFMRWHEPDDASVKSGSVRGLGLNSPGLLGSSGGFGLCEECPVYPCKRRQSRHSLMVPSADIPVDAVGPGC